MTTDINVVTFRVVPTPARLRSDRSAKPRDYTITYSSADKLLVSVQTITSLGYYIAGIIPQD